MKLICKKKQTEIEENICKNHKWKEKNSLYLRELQAFFDRVDRIEDCELRQSILSQMLICDNVLTETAEKMFNNFYEKGYNEAKNG